MNKVSEKYYKEYYVAHSRSSKEWNMVSLYTVSRKLNTTWRMSNKVFCFEALPFQCKRFCYEALFKMWEISVIDWRWEVSWKYWHQFKKNGLTQSTHKKKKKKRKRKRGHTCRKCQKFYLFQPLHKKRVTLHILFNKIPNNFSVS